MTIYNNRDESVPMILSRVQSRSVSFVIYLICGLLGFAKKFFKKKNLGLTELFSIFLFDEQQVDNIGDN